MRCSQKLVILLLGVPLSAARGQGLPEPASYTAQHAQLPSHEASLGTICASEQPGNCQSFNGPVMFQADRVNAPRTRLGSRVADDFIAEFDTLTQLCWYPGFIGYYGTACHAPGETPPDNWDIRFYEDAGGLPGTQLHELIGTAPTDKEHLGSPWRVWRYVLDFDPPLGGFTPGQRYWLEISGAGEDRGCMTYWASSLDGNQWALRHRYPGPSPWLAEDRLSRLLDLAFCLDGGFDIPNPQLGSCCECDGTCTDDVLFQDCTTARDGYTGDDIGNEIGDWSLGPCADGCPAPSTMPNDACADAVEITNGLHPFSSKCANTDGTVDMGNVCGHVQDLQFFNDIWFKYYAECSGEIEVQMISDANFNPVMALYQNPDGTCPSCVPSNNLLVPDGCEPLDWPQSFRGLADAGDCFLIRVGGQGTVEAAGQGHLWVSCERLCKPSFDPVADFSSKNRFLSFTAQESEHKQAIEVTMVDLPPPYDVWNGSQLWLQPPREVSEVGASVHPIDDEPNFMAATLGCTRAEVDWDSFGTIHVFHEGIVPGGTYRLKVIGPDCDDDDRPEMFGRLELTTARWGDTLFDLSQTPPSPPEGFVNINDALGILGRFASAPGAMMKARADLKPACLDLTINVSDVLASVSAFVGLGYPFAPTAPDPCDSTCTNVLP